MDANFNILDTAVGDRVLNAAAIAAIMAASPTAVAAHVSTTAPSTTRIAYNEAIVDYAGAVSVGGGNGSIVGDRGEVNVGNAATVLGAGYYYGTQGKVTAVTGATIGAGARAFGVTGQFDLSLGVVSGNPQLSAVWGDMGATSPASGWGTASSILSGQNTTAAAVNSLLYLYGKATYAVEFDSNGSGVLATAGASNAGSSTHCNANRVLSGIFDGVAGFIPIFNSNA